MSDALRETRGKLETELREIVKKADTKDAQPTGALENPASLREDSLDCDPLERRLDEIAPAWREGYFVLPRLPALDLGALDEDDGQ